jgi:hypothetical protein
MFSVGWGGGGGGGGGCGGQSMVLKYSSMRKPWSEFRSIRDELI